MILKQKQFFKGYSNDWFKNHHVKVNNTPFELYLSNFGAACEFVAWYIKLYLIKVLYAKVYQTYRMDYDEVRCTNAHSV